MSTNPKFINNLTVLETSRFGGAVTFEDTASFDEVDTPLITSTSASGITITPATNRILTLNSTGTGTTIINSGTGGIMLAPDSDIVWILPNVGGDPVSLKTTTGADLSILPGSNADLNLTTTGTGKTVITGLLDITSGSNDTSASFATWNGLGSTNNYSSGRMIVTGVSTAAGSAETLVLNNSKITTSSKFFAYITNYSGTMNTNGQPTIIGSQITGAGVVEVWIKNIHASNALSGNLTISFLVIN